MMVRSVLAGAERGTTTIDEMTGALAMVIVPLKGAVAPALSVTVPVRVTVDMVPLSVVCSTSTLLGSHREW